MRVSLQYQSGDEICLGDRVLYDDIPAQVELIAGDRADPEDNFYIETCGRGVMLIEPTIFGRLFTTAIEQLVFVERGNLEIPHMSTPASTPYIEPWLRGTHDDVPAIGRAVLHAFDLALDDITKWTHGLSDLEVHAQPLGLPAIAFHLKHIARSTDRLLTYAEGGQISAEQLARLKSEQSGCETLAQIMSEFETALSNAADRVRVLATADFNTFRGVGRKQLPTSIGGALVHVADHTQRHVGQVVTTAKVIKALRS